MSPTSPLKTRLIHEVTFDAAADLTQMVGLCLPADQQKPVFDAFYDRVRQALEVVVRREQSEG